MRLSGIAILVTAAFTFAWPAVAQPVFPQQGGAPTTTPPASGQGPVLITEITPDQLVPLLNAESYPSQVNTDNKGSKWVVTSFWGQNLYSGVLFSGNCDKNSDCTMLNFFANFGKSSNVNQNWVNAWNMGECCVRAYFLSDQSLIFQYDVQLGPGVTADYIKAAAQTFKEVVDGAANFKP
ncbi:MAG TPA: YbjN domain-containing protein [Methylovirgula sp.]|nr:YbjN domain-containing protein [Methylovirgula sp.]